MDQQRERIQADLRGLLDGEVRCDDVFVQMYATDASVYEIRPLGVVRPRSVADVVACVQYAVENAIPLHPRGAGTGLAGEALGAGLVLDFSHGMRRVIREDEETVTIQPGVVHAILNRQLALRGRTFGPDPATGSVSTMGSVLALDSAGSRWLRYGSARSHVVNLQVVLGDGSVVQLAQHELPTQEAQGAESTAEASLVRRTTELLRREASLIADYRSETCVNRAGYHLFDVLSESQLNLARMFVGSEGTLGLITEATVRVDRLPASRGVALLFFDRIEHAARAAIELAELDISACDLMDRRLLNLARETDARYESILPPEAEALLLVECDGDSMSRVRDALEQVVARATRKRRLAFAASIALEKEEIDLYWRLARRVIPTLYRLKGQSRPLPFIEDIAVPPKMLPDFLVTLQNVLKNHQVIASLFGHAGHGQLHVRPFLDLGNPDDVRTMQALATDLYEEVLRVGGTISGEHGDGLSRTWFVRRQYGPLYDVFREVKRIFDPHNILNPGKVVADMPQPLTKNLRPGNGDAHGSTGALIGVAESRSPSPADEPRTIHLQLAWNSEEVAYAARACNGCGRCRTQLASERMCPIFRFAPREEASPRAKANLMRSLMTGRLAPTELDGSDLKEVADLCINCHQCRVECPASVDIPKLMIECKAQHYATNGISLSDWWLTRVDLLAALGSRFSRIANWAIGHRQMRWLIERVFRVAQGRKLPRFAPRAFLRQASRDLRSRDARGGRRVLYFVDVFANWHDLALAEAIIAILQHNGVSVYVPGEQLPSGMALLSAGAVEPAKRIARKNVALLAEAVRQGYWIVASEPSAAMCLTREYPSLLDEPEARLVAENSSEACTYLWRMHQVGELELDLKPVNADVGYHEPCHLRALSPESPGEKLLRLIPGLTVRRLDHGCSGMGGTFGLHRDTYRASLRAGWGLISAMREPGIQVGVTECSACKLQMEQGTTKPTIHPLKLLALAYGLKPEFASLLTARGDELMAT